MCRGFLHENHKTFDKWASLAKEYVWRGGWEKQVAPQGAQSQRLPLHVAWLPRATITSNTSEGKGMVHTVA